MLQICVQPVTVRVESLHAPSIVRSVNWESRLPVLSGERLELRELRPEDAGDLLASIGSPEVYHHIQPPPSTVAGFQRFIEWTRTARSKGRHACFGIVPREVKAPVGFIQIWPLGPRSAVAEWGFVLDRRFWGTGMFGEAAELVIEFAVDAMRVHRIEGRASVENGRGNGALHKLGADRECTLRQCFELHGRPVDHVLWALLADEWRERRG